MPTVLRVQGFRFYFFSLDRGSRLTSTSRKAKLAKYWLVPVELASSERFRAHELNRVRALVVEHRVLFQESWDEHFSGQIGED